jgi:hypothetical protein
MRDNYEACCEEWRKKALGFDYKDRYMRLGLPGYTDSDLPISYYGVPYLISREDAGVTRADRPDARVDVQTALAIYHLFYYSSGSPVNTGRFIPFREVRGAAPFDPAFKKQILVPFARAFEGKKELLIAAGESLGFQRLGLSDAGFEAKAFECMPIRFLFWDGDDEFPAQANILFDENITEFTHEETVVTIASDGIRRFLDAARTLAGEPGQGLTTPGYAL